MLIDFRTARAEAAVSRRETHERREAATVAALGDALDQVFPAKGACGFCGDTVVGQRHRVMDSIAEQIRAGEDWRSVVDDFDPPATPGDDSWQRLLRQADVAIYALAVSR